MSYHEAECFYLDGSVFCPDCAPEDGSEDEIYSVAYVDNHETCEVCSSFTVFSTTYSTVWFLPEDNTREWVRWATCDSCNGSKAFRQDEIDTRLDARRDKLICPNCHGRLHF